MMYILAIISYIVAIFLNVDRHYKKWKHGQKQPDVGNTISIRHFPESLIRFLMFAPSVFFLWVAIGFTWIDFAKSVFTEVSITWFLFDGLFNIKRGKDWWFIGTVDKDESFFDNVKRSIGPVWTKILQIGLILFSISLIAFS